MRKKLFAQGSIAVTAAVAVLLSACNKAPETTPTDKGTADKKPAPADSGGAGSPESKPAVPASSSNSVADQIKGYWAPDKDGMIASTKAEMEKSGGVDAAALAFATQMITMMADKMVIEIGDGKVTILSPDGPEEESLKVGSSDAATGDFVVSSVDADGTEQTGKGNIQGDKLTLTMGDGGEAMVMNRLSDAEYAKRKAEIESFKPPGLPDADIPGIDIPDAPDADADAGSGVE